MTAPGASAAPAPAQSSVTVTAASAPLGINLPGIHDWMHTPVYVDLVHQARRYGSPAAPWDERAPLGPDGWPIGDFGVVLSTGLAGYSRSAGTYRLSFTGKARIAAVASDARVANVVHDAATGTTRADVVVAPGATQLMLAFTDTGAGIRDLKVLRPGYAHGDTRLFTDEFLAHVARFPVLRFMDWLRTNDSTVSTWSGRARPESTRHASSAGVPWEHVIALANQVRRDVWINVPVAADDDYVVRLARLLRTTLHPAAVVYVEYSNELWNPQFTQHAVNRRLAVAEVKADPASALARGGARDPEVLALRRIGERLKRISDIFRAEWGEAAMMTRVRPVLAAQVAQPHVGHVILSHMRAAHGPPARYFWALAGAPYFNLGARQTAEGLSVGDVLEAMDASIRRLPRDNALEANVAQASWHGLRFLGYEGGADTFGPGSLAAKKAANLDERMQSLCTRYLATWYEAGGGLMMWFTAGAGNWDTPYGAWELTTDLARTDTPKLRCLDQALGAPAPPARGRNAVPGSFPALAYVGNFPPYTAQSATTLRYLHPGSHVDYLVHAEQGGAHALTLTAAAKAAGNTVDVLVNGETAATGFEFAAAGWDRPVPNRPIALALRPGFNTLRIATRGAAPRDGGYSLVSLTIAPPVR